MFINKDLVTAQRKHYSLAVFYNSYYLFDVLHNRDQTIPLKCLDFSLRLKILTYFLFFFQILNLNNSVDCNRCSKIYCFSGSLQHSIKPLFRV